MGVVPKVSPATYVGWYQVIDVCPSKGPVRQAGVTRYLCNLPQYGGVGDSPVFWQCILQAARDGQVFYNSSHVAGAGQCFWGKGSPDDVAHALRIVEDVAQENPGHPSLKRFQDVLTGDDRVAKVCDQFIGVDCNGFIGNLGVENGIPQASPNLLPGLWKNVGPIDKWRSSVDEIQPLDVLIWPHDSHIAIIHDVKDGRFTVCQSTGGGGPQISFGHSIAAAGMTPDNKPQFLVGSGARQDGKCPITLPAKVRIKSIGFDVTNYHG